MSEGFVLVHMHRESEKDNLVESRQKKKTVDKNGYLVLWSEFNQKPVQFLQGWCHIIVFGLSKNSFAALFWTLSTPPVLYVP